MIWSKTWKQVLIMVFVFDILGLVFIEAFFGVDSLSRSVYQDTLIYSFVTTILSLLASAVIYRTYIKNANNEMRDEIICE